MAQPRSLSRSRTQAPARSSTVSPTVLVVGGVVALAAIGAVIALSSNAAAASPSPTPPPPSGGGNGAGKPCPASNLPPTLHTLRLANSGTTIAVSSGDAVHTALLLNPPQTATYHWVVQSSDSSILSKIKSTTGPDPQSPNGTDYLDYFTAVGAGTATLTGQLVPKSGLGAAIGSFSVTVNVTCKGSGVGVVNLPGSPAPVAVAAGTTHNLIVANPGSSVPVPTVPAAQAVLDAKLGAGAVTVLSATAYKPGVTVVSVRANKAVNFTAGVVLQAVGINTAFIVSSSYQVNIT